MAELDVPFSDIQETLKRTVSALVQAEIPFLIGSLVVTAWLIATGVSMLRSTTDVVMPDAAVPAQPTAPVTPTRTS